jgi:hypothetical protein
MKLDSAGGLHAKSLHTKSGQEAEAETAGMAVDLSAVGVRPGLRGRPEALIVLAVLVVGTLVAPLFLVQHDGERWGFPSSHVISEDVPAQPECVSWAGSLLNDLTKGRLSDAAQEVPTFLAAELRDGSTMDELAQLVAVKPVLSVGGLGEDWEFPLLREAEPSGGTLALATLSELLEADLGVVGGAALQIIGAMGLNREISTPALHPKAAAVPSSEVDRGGHRRILQQPSAQDIARYAVMVAEDERTDATVRAMFENADDAYLRSLAPRVGAIDAPGDNEIPLRMRVGTTAEEHGDLSFIPFSRRYIATETLALPSPPAQPRTELRPKSITEILTNQGWEKMKHWLFKLRWNLATARRLGENAPECTKKPKKKAFGTCKREISTLVIGQDEFHANARGIVWDLRPMENGDPARPLDFHAPISSAWNNEYISRRLLGATKWPDQQVVDMVLHGVKYQAEVDLQIVLCPHLQSLALGVADVEKTLKGHLDDKEYSIHQVVPFIPIRVTAQGVVLQKDKARRISDLGAPRNIFRDLQDIAACSINKAIDLRKSLKRAASAMAADAVTRVARNEGAAAGAAIGRAAGGAVAGAASVLARAGARLGGQLGGVLAHNEATRRLREMRSPVVAPGVGDTSFSIGLDEDDPEHDDGIEEYYRSQSRDSADKATKTGGSTEKWTAPETKPRPEDVAHDSAILRHAAHIWKEPLLGGTDDVKGYFTQLPVHSSELWKNTIAWQYENDDVDGSVDHIVEYRLGFGMSLSPNVAQRWSHAIICTTIKRFATNYELKPILWYVCQGIDALRLPRHRHGLLTYRYSYLL